MGSIKGGRSRSPIAVRRSRRNRSPFRRGRGRSRCPRCLPPPPEKPAQPSACLRLPILDKLLPNADTGDTLLLLILLLLLSDGNEDSQSVALTLAIFLFLQ